jgi:hypothetical protein
MIMQCCAVSMLRSADLCNAAYLREACVSFIVDHFKAVVVTEQCVSRHQRVGTLGVSVLDVHGPRYAQLPSELMLSVQVCRSATAASSFSVRL